MVKALLGLLISVALTQTPTTTINYLIEHAPTRDQQTITIEAEAIGEVLERGDHAWINVNDGSNAIGIYMTADQSKIVKTFGDYFNTGDKLRITGVFYRACIEHGGEMDIHATSVTVIRSGQTSSHPISPLEFAVTVILLSLALTALYVKRDFFNRPKINLN